jgi:hypothetical protein
MRQSWIKIIRAYFVLVFALILSACGAEVFQKPDASPQEVGFYAGGGTDTRTEMLPNGLSAVWTSGDELAVWARNSAGNFTLYNQVFKTYGTDRHRGYFTSTLSEAMPEDTYTYYCTYPVPESADGTVVTFDIPSVQDGKVTGGADIMIATPVRHGGLTSLPDLEDHSGMSMHMNRMLHQFRFFVPADNTVLGNRQITKIVLTFPRNVVGTTSFDVSDPSAPGVLSDGSSQVSLILSSPLTTSTASSVNYACVAVNPCAFKSGEMLQVKAYTSTEIVHVDPIDLCARNFQAGHSTPVKLKVRSVTDYPYQLSFRVAANNLGEKPRVITLTAPSSCVWEGYDSNVLTYDPGREIEVGETITIRFENEASFRAFSGKNISIVYDSENALTSQTVKIADLSSTDSVTTSLTVPYLFFEDFSGIPTFSDGHDNPKVGTASDTYKGISELSSYSLTDWYGTRIGGQSGTSLRICCRYEHVLLDGAYYKGRAYTPFLSGIKDGKDVNITVSFRYGSNRSERDPLLGSRPEKNAIMYFGINTQETVTNPDEVEGNLIDSITGMIAGSGFSSAAPTSLKPMVISNEKMATSGGSFTSFEGTKNVTVNNVDNGMRLAWIVSTDNTSSNTNGNYWLYIDDIKVQIKQN